MTTLIDGLNLKLCDILKGNNFDIHGHEITFEKTGDLEYCSVYLINCNRKYVIDLSSVFVTIKEIIIPDEDVIYREAPSSSINIYKQNQDIEVTRRFENTRYSKMEELVKQ